MIVLHYTGMQFCHEAIHRLCDTKARVSSHYVVLETGSIVQLVQEGKRAWHAGVSVWGGDPDVNSRSIGIEICNPGHDFGYPDFPSRQIAATITLCRSILTRHIIRPENIVAHSDVAPSRKNDPGEKFPWKRLAQSGVGLWVDVGAVADGEATQAQRHRHQDHRPADGRSPNTATASTSAAATTWRPRKSSPPSSAISVQPRSTASPMPRPCRRCASSWSRAIAQPRLPKHDREDAAEPKGLWPLS